MADINITQDEADKLMAWKSARPTKGIGSFPLRAKGLPFR